MATPIYELVLGAYRYANITKRPLTGLSNSEQQEGLEVLNSLLDQWRGEELTVYARSRIVFPIVANQVSYLIGTDTSAGIPDWIFPRPETILQAGFIFTNTTQPYIEQPFEIYTEQDWAALSPKALTSTIATVLYYEPLVPNGKVWIWPIPTQNWQIALYLWITLQEVSGIDAQIDLPPAYRLALEANLALLLGMRYGVPASPILLNQARASKAVLKNINWEPLKSVCEAASLGVNGRDNGGYGRFSIFSNTYIR